jgi:hypothetical protein
MNGYAMSVNDWVLRTEREFEDYVPYKFPREILEYDNKVVDRDILKYDNKVVDHDIFDRFLYFLATIWRDNIIYNIRNGKNKTEEEKKDKNIWIVPYTFGNTVYIVDRYTNEVQDVIHKNPYGVSYYGLEGHVTKLGGRGELHQIGADMDDGKMYSGY